MCKYVLSHPSTACNMLQLSLAVICSYSAALFIAAARCMWQVLPLTVCCFRHCQPASQAVSNNCLQQQQWPQSTSASSSDPTALCRFDLQLKSKPNRCSHANCGSIGAQNNARRRERHSKRGG